MTTRMLSISRRGQPPAAWTGIALSLALTAAMAEATVLVTEPSAYTISKSDIICVARVDSVLGTDGSATPPLRRGFGCRPPRGSRHTIFTNRNPPDVLVTVRDGIKGTKLGETLHVVRWVTGAPGWSEPHGRTEEHVRLWEAKPTVPPPIGAELLLFLKHLGQQGVELIRGQEGPVFVTSPDARTIETVRGVAWLDFTVRPIPEVQRPRSPVAISGTIANRAPDSMWFDLRHAQVTYWATPTHLAPGERWRPHPPPPIRLAPGERRKYSFHVENISRLPIGVPGHYGFGFYLPANVNGQGAFIPVHFRIDGEMKLRDAAAASWVVFAATVDSIFPFRPDLGPSRSVSLIDHRFLLGELHSSPPGNVLAVDWRRDLRLRATPGRRCIFFLDRQWQVFHVAEMNRENLESVQAGLVWAKQNM